MKPVALGVTLIFPIQVTKKLLPAKRSIKKRKAGQEIWNSLIPTMRGCNELNKVVDLILSRAREFGN